MGKGGISNVGPAVATALVGLTSYWAYRSTSPIAEWPSLGAALFAGALLGHHLAAPAWAEPRELEEAAAADVSDGSSDDETSDLSLAATGEPCKLMLCVRGDLKMGKGKIAAQCGHATLGAFIRLQGGGDNEHALLGDWFSNGQAKIAVKLADEVHLDRVREAAKAAGLLTHVVRDAGHTQVDPGSRTVLAILGPESVLRGVTGELKLL